MLWLALYLPALPLEVHTRGQAQDTPLAVLEQGRVLLANEPTVRPGLGRNAALALSPELQLKVRDGRAEADALARLSDWALQFSSWVSPEPPDTLLLEAGGSLRLFGGAQRFQERVHRELRELGYQGRLALAPTPRGAWLLARAGLEGLYTGEADFQAALRRVPCEVLAPDGRCLQAMRDLGLRDLGDCLALPRGGLRRRLGAALGERLDQAQGLRPEPRKTWQSPPRFHSRLELPTEVEHCGQLVFALGRLLRELSGALRGRDAALQHYELALEHPQGEATRLGVGLLRPARDPAHLLALGQERLERLRLRAPVRAVRLRCDDIRPWEGETASLLEQHARQGDADWRPLAERLSVRLGTSAVRGLSTVDEHRPEKAWRHTDVGQGLGRGRPQRPLWLLEQPLALHQRGQQPLWHGPLRLERGPERIESGWWDGEDQRRDYYQAVNPAGARLWVFQERAPERRWYLHGFFS
ncbi:Y-family DNA polymerase [Alkalilimnicola sp. S0819]|uniref:Y-family DNA polymerase n=1 Tax=Alkalilimnicola sp. S0819 TaxID=2613922 RepID=UPI001262A2E9|nr:DNA polymerase Y family protein [Alkalilimnicola sp. S0819]KAB7627641.1 DNA polymerase Y family protein [Alkalilimnicola sp. S0819]MPQ15806.1 DNA polymerase Y family protein [Alkalilimnicola sp. S0819]